MTIQAKKFCSIHLEAFDADQPHTFYIRRDRSYVPGEIESLYVQIPLSGKNTVVDITESGLGDTDNFTVIKVTKTALARRMTVGQIKNQGARYFAELGQRFAFNAGVLPTYEDRDYVSAQGNFRIHYVPLISDDGSVQVTPARIDKTTKVIEASKVKFIDMTVPIRFCILCHEFSHLFLNENMYDESEADINGLIIYLGLGYPVVEAKETFLNILNMSSTEQNQQRYELVVKFIDQYESGISFDHL